MKTTIQFGTKERTTALMYALAGFILFNLGYLSIFYLVARVTGSYDELRSLWSWGVFIGALIGVQSGLFGYARSVLASRKSGLGGSLALSGGSSLGAMIACCSHLLVLFLPLIGVSFLAGLLGRLQMPLLYLSLFINAFAIFSQMILLKQHRIISPGSWLGRANLEHIKAVRLIIITAAIPVLLLNVTTISDVVGNDSTPPAAAANSAREAYSGWGEMTDSANLVSVSVIPLLDEVDQRIGFSIAFETHSVDLDFDPARIAELTINRTSAGEPLRWEGPSPGGHHISGILWFEGSAESLSSLKLVLRGIAGADREFEWS